MNEKFEDYEGDYVVFRPDADDDCMKAVRAELQRLTLAERRIFLMVLEAGTFTEVSHELHCSVPTISKKFKAIADKIAKKTEKICKEF